MYVLYFLQVLLTTTKLHQVFTQAEVTRPGDHPVWHLLRNACSIFTPPTHMPPSLIRYRIALRGMFFDEAQGGVIVFVPKVTDCVGVSSRAAFAPAFYLSFRDLNNFWLPKEKSQFNNNDRCWTANLEARAATEHLLRSFTMKNRRRYRGCPN